MKKILSLFSKHVIEILVLLLIIVIGLYIIYFAGSITDKAEKLMTGIAAGVSTFFLFLAFRESKKSNELKMVEFFYAELNNQVTEFEKTAKSKLFKINEESIVDGLKYSNDELMKITYANFIYGMQKLLTHIENDSVYNKYKQMMSNQLNLGLNDEGIEEVKYIINALSKIYVGFEKLFYFYFISIEQLYKSIDKFPIDRELKILLIERLNIISSEYSTLHRAIGKGTGDESILLHFAFFDIENKELIRLFPISPGGEVLKRINSIKDKYKEETFRINPLRHSLDRFIFL